MKIKDAYLLLLLIPLLIDCMEKDDKYLGETYDQFEKQIESRKKNFYQILQEKLQDQLAQKKDLNAPIFDYDSQTTTKSLTLLHKAVLYDNSGKTVRQLLEAGADPNVKDSKSNTPLQLASIYLSANNSVNNIQALLEHNADPDLAEKDYNETPLFAIYRNFGRTPEWMFSNGAKKAIKLFLAYGANLSVRNKRLQTPFQATTSLNKLSVGQAMNFFEFDLIMSQKKAAYFRLLTGQQRSQSSHFIRLPFDMIREIINKLFPHYPWEPYSYKPKNP